MSDLRLANAGTFLIGKLMDAVIDSGNSVFTMIQPTFLEMGYNCKPYYNEKDFAHITEVTPFSVNIQDAQPIYEMCQHIKDGITDRAEYLAGHKYR
jgi:TRAP-type mannitol/chloroaromatic compound transport system substrate-binding protein